MHAAPQLPYQALQLLTPGGVLFTFSCSGGISADLFHKIVASAGADAGVDGYILERLGGAPDHPERRSMDWDLQPGMTLSTKLLAVQELQPGDTVGYGSSFTADAPMTLGVAACGYADGYPRHCGTGTPVLVEGVRTRTVGRVSMDMLAVDLTPVPDAGMGSEVTLWGRASNGAVLPIDEVAEAAGTLGYELMCAVAPRVNKAVD